MRLDSKRIVITGAVDNIGKAAVQAFIAEGAKVVIGDIDTERGTKVAEEFGPSVKFVRVDVSDETSVENLIGDAVDWLGGLDVLAQNAGLMMSGSILDFDTATFDRLFAVNVKGLFLGAKHAVPHLKKSGKGSIINTASLAAKRGGPGLTLYSASKGAVISFSSTLAIELAHHNIRVNTICPGWVDTAFNKPIIDFMGGETEQMSKVSSMVPLGRQGLPGEIAPLFVFLASDESSYMTAQAILADGGAYST
ncbi:SDR family oxidoreductase [Rhizobium sp. BK376]|uniref:SDR family NAD(P)-dependent oxidoreductase n=1 Tax=Rhizobium sp. BK376 TaxID=2512149 RepID=UPI00104A53FF|nr:SDR family oxidoreductase [Rhizobium sp. BK376]TCR69570.1 dihydroanticapsin dehydrogenase [Rhizobium sp. BK376]